MKIDQTTNRIFFQKGFSLVELSIVLVILGLLTGGILTGQSLIRAAELRAITTEVAQYQTAVNTFQQKYFALPGDMPNAESFWSAASTDNGDGDGVINYGPSAGVAHEGFMFWNHLAFAGLIEGQYTGIAGASHNIHAIYRQNIPESRISGSGYMIYTHDHSSGANTNGWIFGYYYMNSLIYGRGANNSPHWWTGQEAVSPEELWNIDTKIDDGQPARGKLHTMNWQWGCVVANSGALAYNNFDVRYNVANTQLSCPMIFYDIFK